MSLILPVDRDLQTLGLLRKYALEGDRGIKMYWRRRRPRIVKGESNSLDKNYRLCHMRGYLTTVHDQT